MRIQVIKKFEKFLSVSKPIKIAIGGRGSGKSIGFGDIFTVKMLSENADIYCLREYQDSINDSVHRVFEGSINNRLNLDGWTIQRDSVIAPTGAKTTYRGAARNPDSIQSAQSYKYSWFEEAHRASKASLDKLLPTILRNPGAECWFSANPQSSTDPFSERFINPYKQELDTHGYYEDDLHLIQIVNWRDNPWWNAEQEALRAWDYDNRARAEYNWIWEGHFNDAVEDCIIMPEWIDASIDAHKKIKGIDQGVKSIGFDPADSGKDDKAVVLRHGGLIYECESWTKGDLSDAITKAFDVAYATRSTEFVYDSIGVGAGVAVALRQMVGNEKLNITKFIGGASVDDPELKYKEDQNNEDVFRNKRGQYGWYLRDRFEKTYNFIEKGIYTDPQELISLSSEMPQLNLLKTQLLSVSRKRNIHNSLIQLLSKQEMAYSPGLFDACMMCFANPAIFNDSVYDNWAVAING